METSEPYQRFTAIGIVQDDEPYQVIVNDSFQPYRRNVKYYQNITHLNIKPLISELGFIKNKKSWGYVFRYGFLEIDPNSFNIIAKGMLGYVPNTN